MLKNPTMGLTQYAGQLRRSAAWVKLTAYTVVNPSILWSARLATARKGAPTSPQPPKPLDYTQLNPGRALCSTGRRLAFRVMSLKSPRTSAAQAGALTSRAFPSPSRRWTHKNDLGSGPKWTIAYYAAASQPLPSASSRCHLSNAQSTGILGPSQTRQVEPEQARILLWCTPLVLKFGATSEAGGLSQNHKELAESANTQVEVRSSLPAQRMILGRLPGRNHNRNLV